MGASSQNITKLLLDWRNGDNQALDRLMPLVYEELRRMANNYMRNERRAKLRPRRSSIARRRFRIASGQLSKGLNPRTSP